LRENTVSVLLILPCNRGAKEGNFFPYGAWKQALAVLRKDGVEKEFVTFAAVDSIITKFDPVNDRDEKGAIVLESEMERVKGYDFKPSWRHFKTRDFAFLKEHTAYCEIALERLLERYDLILVCISVRGYKYAVIRAALSLGEGRMPENMVIIDCGESPSFQNNGIAVAVKMLKRFRETGVIRSAGYIVKPEKVNPDGRFLVRPENIPKEYIYWDKEFYRFEEVLGL